MVHRQNEIDNPLNKSCLENKCSLFFIHAKFQVKTVGAKTTHSNSQKRDKELYYKEKYSYSIRGKKKFYEKEYNLLCNVYERKS